MNYYVDYDGVSDANNGLSVSTAWKTTGKVNNSRFLPGDSVLFKRGQVWKDNLIVPSSGNAAAPITFGAYGDGNKPLISGELLPHPERTVAVSGKSYVTLEDLNIAYNNCTWCGVLEARNSSHLNIRNCDIHDAATYFVLYFLETTDSVIENCHIYGNRGADTYGGVVSLANSHRNVIRSSTIHDTAASLADVVTLSNASDNVVESNTIYGPAENGVYVRPGSRNTIRYNYIHHINGIGIQLRDNARDNLVYYNILLHNDGPTIQSDGKNGAGASGNKIYNNVIYNDGNARGIHIIAVPGENYGTEVKNNIVITENENVLQVDVDSRNSGVAVDYNCYYQRSDGHAPFYGDDDVWTPYYSLESWRAATGLDTHSIFADPWLTTDPPVDSRSVILRAGSVCINGGVDVGLTRDFTGNAVPHGSAPEVGAYESAVAPAPPGKLRVLSIP